MSIEDRIYSVRDSPTTVSLHVHRMRVESELALILGCYYWPLAATVVEIKRNRDFSSKLSCRRIFRKCGNAFLLLLRATRFKIQLVVSRLSIIRRLFDAVRT